MCLQECLELANVAHDLIGINVLGGIEVCVEKETNLVLVLISLLWTHYRYMQSLHHVVLQLFNESCELDLSVFWVIGICLSCVGDLKRFFHELTSSFIDLTCNKNL